MADKTVIIKLDVQEAGAISSIEGLNNSLKKLDKTSDEYAVILKKIQAEETKLASIQKQRAGTQKSVTKALGKQSDATGSATAATMELSRVISDAPYGIRGMANNITQLVSQLGTASLKAGGLTNALKLMWAQMMGPLGIVFAITAAVAALDYFKGGMKKSKDEAKELNDELKKTNELLSEINTVLDTLNVSGDSIKFEWLDAFAAGVDSLDTKGLLKVLERDIKGITNAFNKLPKEEQNIQGIESLVQKKKDLIENLLKEKNIKNELIKLDKDYLVYRSLGDSDKKKALTEEITRKQKELFATQKSIIDTEELFKKQKDEKDKPKDKVDVLGLDSIDIGENKKKMKKVLDAVADAVGVDLKKDPLKIDTNIDLELSDEAKKIIADKLKRDLNNLMLDSKLEDAKNFIDKSKEVLGAMTDFVNSEFERELTIEQNKTNALNTELNNRLNNENLSKDQRASIQNQIAQNDEKLRVKQDAIEKKKFKMNKAARIANALMDTASAAVGVMADSKGDFFARLANAIPTIAFGLAQVAAISRQKFQSSSSKTPISTASGAGGSGDARAEPSFNIVGRSSDNILLSAIQSQFDQPLRAYVVARDVTNQQQLDGVISTAAST